MKHLLYLLRRMSGLELAELIGINSANISIWLKNKQIPGKHQDFLKLLVRSYKDVPKR
jgi:transcriptional regulator with XRE-family HTH domain